MQSPRISLVPGLSLLAVSAFMAPANAAEFYVSPTGSGNGSLASPWSLSTALAHPAAVRPGDTIWVMGGNYNGCFTSRLRGTATAPIIVRNYLKQRAVLRCDAWPSTTYVLEVQGAATWFWGLELMATREVRSGERAGGLNVFGPYMKFINMVIHDTAGIGVWNGSDDTELYGTAIFDNGYEGGDRGHGHAYYSQNRLSTKHFVDNVYFNSFGHGIHLYGSEAAYLNNYHIEGNIGFNNGIMSYASGITSNMLVGGGNPAVNYQVLNNITFFTPNARGYGRSAIFGYNGARCSDFTIRGNTFAGSPVGLIMGCTSTTMDGNTIVGLTSGFSQSSYPNNTYLTSNTNGQTRIYIRPNRYEPGRAHVAVANWAGLGSIALDLSSVLNVGDQFEIIDVQDYFGAPILTGTYAGAPVGVTLLNTGVYRSFGTLPVPPVHTPSLFNAFLVRRTTATTTPAPPPPVVTPPRAPVVSAGSNQTITLPAGATLSGSVTDAGYPITTVTTTWSKVSGPGTVTFANASAAQTTATFSMAGTYVLKLDVSNGTLSSSASVTITVNPALAPAPVITNPPPPVITVPPPNLGTPAAGPVRINSGGALYTERSGIQWTADTAFTGGTAFSSPGPIVYTSDLDLFSTQRQGSFTYRIPVRNGLWYLQLSFAELVHSAAGKRLFDVYINDVLRSKNYDVFARSGGRRVALNQGFTLDIKTGYIDVRFVGVVDTAIVNRIQLLPVQLY